MNCPFCSHSDSLVVDTRQSLYNQIEGIRRRRQCLNCNQRFSSFEMSIQDLEGVEPATLDGILQQIIKVFRDAPRTNYKAPPSPVINQQVPEIINGHKASLSLLKSSTKEARKNMRKEIQEAMKQARINYAKGLDELDASEFDDSDFNDLD